MIEKKIKYDINIEKPSKTKPVTQGGDLNLYGSLKGKPNRGPFGLPSLQGSGGGSEGAGSDSSGTGASEGTAQGPGPNEGAEAGQAAANAAEAAADAAAAAAQNSFSPDIGGIVGPGPGQQDVTGFGTSYSDADMGPVGQNAMGQVDALAQTLEDQANREKNPATARLSPLGVAAYNMSLTNPTRTTAEKAMGLVTSPLSTLAATAYDAYARGVSRPGTEQYDQDYAKMDLTTDVVNVGPETNTPSDGGGINTLQAYAPLYNSPVTSGDSTMDAYIRRLRINLGLPV